MCPHHHNHRTPAKPFVAFVRMKGEDQLIGVGAVLGSKVLMIPHEFIGTNLEARFTQREAHTVARLMQEDDQIEEFHIRFYEPVP